MKKKAIFVVFCLMFVVGFTGCSAEKPKDGTYTVEVSLSGGSGKSNIEQATITIKEESAVATVVWSSPFYESMMVEGKEYLPEQKTGNSTFTFPAVLDREMKVSATTVAMSQPHTIDYTLYFDSKTLKGEKE